MIKRLATIAAIGFVATAAYAATPPVLTLHIVQEIPTPPVIDGKLDDACWQTLPQYTTFYAFNVMSPKPTPLKTAFQLAYDKNGLYLGIRMFETNMLAVKATITQNGDQELWEDDCDEIYIDSTATAIGFRKFVVNALGTHSTAYRMDPANIDFSWNPDRWRVATSRDDKAWYIEAFFPWSDLGRTAQDGDLWRFAICRFSWSTDHLASSSVGASYAAPERYGWLLFMKSAAANPNALASQLASRIAGDWLLPLPSGTVEKVDGKISVTSMPGLLSQLKKDTTKKLAECRKLVADDPVILKKCDDLAIQLGELVTDTQDPVIFQQNVVIFGKMDQQLEDLKYTRMLQDLTAAPRK